MLTALDIRLLRQNPDSIGTLKFQKQYKVGISPTLLGTFKKHSQAWIQENLDFRIHRIVSTTKLKQMLFSTLC